MNNVQSLERLTDSELPSMLATIRQSMQGWRLDDLLVLLSKRAFKDDEDVPAALAHEAVGLCETILKASSDNHIASRALGLLDAAQFAFSDALRIAAIDVLVNLAMHEQRVESMAYRYGSDLRLESENLSQHSSPAARALAQRLGLHTSDGR